MRTLEEYQKEAEKHLSEGFSYMTVDVSSRMLILAMSDFLEELNYKFQFDDMGSLKVTQRD